VSTTREEIDFMMEEWYGRIGRKNMDAE